MEENKPKKNIFQDRWVLTVAGTSVVAVVAFVLISVFFGFKRHRTTDPMAPGFALRNQHGKLTSLAQFRGKVVVLAFIDPVCTQLCPLTTKSMVDALKILGPTKASQVQLLGVNVNPLKTTVADVADYTRVHELQGRWQFLTGSVKQLKRVWKDYHVYVAAPHGDVVHEAVVYIIGRHGHERSVFSTPMSYEDIGLQAQTLSGKIANLLPGLPAASSSSQDSKQPKAPLKPTEAVSMTALGPKHQAVTLGGTHPHLVLFFAGWLRETSDLEKKLATLDTYAAMARRQHWPSPVAVDELTTEPSPAEAQKVLTPLVATLHAPIVQDENGRLADGYQVNDLPWFVLTSSSGKILWKHDGWLNSSALTRQVRTAMGKH